MIKDQFKDYRTGFNEGLSDGAKCQRKPFKYFNQMKEQGYSDGYNCALRGGSRTPAKFMRFSPPMIVQIKLRTKHNLTAQK